MSATRTVLFDMTSLDTPSRYRGFGRYIRDLAIGLSRLSAQSGHDLRILGLTQLGWLGDFQITEDLAGFKGSANIPTPRAADHYRQGYRRRVALWRATQRLGVDLVHLGDPQATPLGRGLTHAIWVVTCHDLIGLRFPKHYYSIRDGFGMIGRRLERRRFTTADHVVAISDATRCDLKRYFRLPDDRITRVYNGIDLARWQRPTPPDANDRLARMGLRDRRFFVYAGDADWRKNVEGMASGLARARAKGHDLDLVMAGALADAKARRVREIAQASGVDDFVRRLGHVDDDDLLTLFRTAVANVFVSRAEGFGLPVVEAMACGCPVITTRETSLGEVAGDAAQLVDPDDAEGIGRAMVAFATDEGLRSIYVEKGKAKAELFSNDHQAREMVALYRKLLGMN